MPSFTDSGKIFLQDLVSAKPLDTSSQTGVSALPAQERQLVEILRFALLLCVALFGETFKPQNFIGFLFRQRGAQPVLGGGNLGRELGGFVRNPVDLGTDRANKPAQIGGTLEAVDPRFTGKTVQ